MHWIGLKISLQTVDHCHCRWGVFISRSSMLWCPPRLSAWPNTFLGYINDLSSCVSSNVRLFANDSTLYKQIKSIMDCQSLQCDLTKLESWERIWGMCFHQDKCNIIRMTRKNTSYPSQLRPERSSTCNCNTNKIPGYNLECKSYLEQPHQLNSK